MYDAAHYSSKEKGFKFNWEYDIDNPCGACNTFFHESGHMLDDLIGQDLGEDLYSSAINKLSDLAKEDFNDAVNRVMEENSCDIKNAIEIIENDLYNNESATVQDIYSGASNNGLYVIWDHQSEAEVLVDKNGERIGTRTYWHRTDNQGKMTERFNRIGKEAFANITADIACNNSQAISYIQKYLPKTFAQYSKIIGSKK